MPGVVVALLAIQTFAAARAYRDRETLWRDTISKNPDSYLAQYNLGVELERLGRRPEAEVCYAAALRCRPDVGDALNNLALARFADGALGSADSLFRRVIALRPGVPIAHGNFGGVLAAEACATSSMPMPRYASALGSTWMRTAYFCEP